MNTITILFIWTTVASAGTQYSVYDKKGWQYMGEFSSPAACERAINKLGWDEKIVRCVAK